jgi:hypothetical protein
MSRLAEAASAFPGGKSALAATAMAAVAAVSVPIAATTVRQESHSQRPPVAVAGPATTARPSASSATTVTIDPSTTTTVVTTTTTTTLPPSLAKPFDGLGKGTKALPGPDPTPTTTTTVPPAPVVQADADGDLDGQALQSVGAAPQFDLSGGVKLTTKSHSATGKITGRLFMNGDGSATSDDLTFSFGADKLVLRFRGTITSASTDEAGTSYLVDGVYSLVGGDRFGLRDRGAITVSFHPAGSSSTLRLSLRPGS